MPGLIVGLRFVHARSCCERVFPPRGSWRPLFIFIPARWTSQFRSAHLPGQNCSSGRPRLHCRGPFPSVSHAVYGRFAFGTPRPSGMAFGCCSGTWDIWSAAARRLDAAFRGRYRPKRSLECRASARHGTRARGGAEAPPGGRAVPVRARYSGAEAPHSRGLRWDFWTFFGAGGTPRRFSWR